MRRDGDLIGYALVAVEPDGDVLWSDTWQVGDKVAELETMYLLPEERGRGLGGLLLDTVEAELEERGIPDLAIGAVPGNTGALRFYERRGFRPTWTIVTRFAARETSRGVDAPADGAAEDPDRDTGQLSAATRRTAEPRTRSSLRSSSASLACSSSYSCTRLTMGMAAASRSSSRASRRVELATLRTTRSP